MFETITIEKIVRETDKAVLITCEIEWAGARLGREIWFPKSQIKVEDSTLLCPAWLAKAKLNDVAPRGAWFN